MFNYVPSNQLRKWPLLANLDDATMVKIRKFLSIDEENFYAITLDDRVLAAGQNFSAELGVGHRNKVEGLVEIIGLRGRQVIQIVCSGAGFAFAITRNGELWAWGWNSGRRIGNGRRNKVCLFPELIITSGIVSICVGNENFLALADEGHLYFWGTKLGQFGISINDNQMTPELFRLPESQIAIAIHGGSYHFWILTASDRVFGFGLNRNNILNDKRECILQTAPTELIIEAGEKVKAVACDFFHSIFLTKTGRLYVCGGLDRLRNKHRALRVIHSGGIRFNQIYSIDKNSDDMGFFIFVTANGVCFVAKYARNNRFRIRPKRVPRRLSFTDTLLHYAPTITTPIMLICQFPSLQEWCVENIERQPFTISNSLDIYEVATILDLAKIKKRAAYFIENNADVIRQPKKDIQQHSVKTPNVKRRVCIII